MDYVAIGIYEEHRRSQTSRKTHLGFDLRDDDYIILPGRKTLKVRKPQTPNVLREPRYKRGGWGRIGISRLKPRRR